MVASAGGQPMFDVRGCTRMKHQHDELHTRIAGLRFFDFGCELDHDCLSIGYWWQPRIPSPA